MRCNSIFLLAISVGIGFGAGCEESLEILNEPGQARSVGPVVLDRDSILIPYSVIDREGDDLEVRVEVCEEDERDCGVIFLAPGGDSLAFVSTAPKNTAVSHVVRWNHHCGRLVAGERFDTELTIDYRIRVTVLGPTPSTVLSPTFRLGDDLLVERIESCED